MGLAQHTCLFGQIGRRADIRRQIAQIAREVDALADRDPAFERCAKNF